MTQEAALTENTRRLTHDPGFAQDVSAQAETNLHLCWYCKTCSNGCPFYSHMDLGPHRVLRLAQMGFEKEVLSSSTIWICVGCHTCAQLCPNNIDIASIMDVLRRMALERGISVPQQDVLDFHREVLDSIKRHGRTHKLEIMLRYKIKTREWFQDMDIGLTMLAKRKLDLLPSKIKDPKEIGRLFDKSWRR